LGGLRWGGARSARTEGVRRAGCTCGRGRRRRRPRLGTAVGRPRLHVVLRFSARMLLAAAPSRGASSSISSLPLRWCIRQRSGPALRLQRQGLSARRVLVILGPQRRWSRRLGRGQVVGPINLSRRRRLQTPCCFRTGYYPSRCEAPHKLPSCGRATRRAVPCSGIVCTPESRRSRSRSARSRRLTRRQPCFRDPPVPRPWRRRRGRREAFDCRTGNLPSIVYFLLFFACSLDLSRGKPWARLLAVAVACDNRTARCGRHLSLCRTRTILNTLYCGGISPAVPACSLNLRGLEIMAATDDAPQVRRLVNLPLKACCMKTASAFAPLLPGTAPDDATAAMLPAAVG